MNPEQRLKLVSDQLRKKYGDPRQLSDEEKILNRAKTVSIFVGGRINEVLKALKSSSDFNADATAQLMTSLFIDNFKSWNKEELLYLCCLLHVSTMMETVQEQVDMGLIGIDKDKPI